MTKKLTTHEAVRRFVEVHLNRYDYNLVNYISARHKVVIVCKDHGEFNQYPYDHLSGKGCPKCGVTSRVAYSTKNRDKFISESIAVHGANYSYHLVDYKSSKSKVIIYCNKHKKEFSQRASAHLEGSGCRLCFNDRLAAMQTMQLKTFIEKAEIKHPNMFSYSLVNYVSTHKKVQLVCKKAGHTFYQTPAQHLQGHGCSKCTKNTLKTSSEFIADAVKVHGEEAFSYNFADYTGKHKIVKIVCNTCKTIFEQTPASHLRGSGCKSCAKSGYKTNLPSTLYLFKINEDILGFGITNDFKTRYTKHKSTFKKHSVTHELIATYDCTGQQALAIENHLKQTYEIVDTGIEGFRKEATAVSNLPAILEDIKKLLDTI